MKLFFTLLIAILLFAVTIIIGLKNQQLVDINYLLAANEIRLATLLAIIFVIGFLSACFFAAAFYLKLKMKNRQLRKLNNKQLKELTQLRETPLLEQD